MAFTFDQICRSGGGDLVFLAHIAGMDWASTNDSRLIKALEIKDADPTNPSTSQQEAIATRANLFNFGYQEEAAGGEGVSSWFKTSNHVNIIKNLNPDFGAQVVKFGESKGIDVGTWKTTFLGGKHGYTWRWFSDIVCKGVMGLDVNPQLTSTGTKSAVMSRDYDPAKHSTRGWKDELYWWIDRDEGLKSVIDTRLAAGHAYLWVGDSCLHLAAGDSVSTDGDEYHITAYNQCFNTPNEQIFMDNTNGVELKRIYNYPHNLQGAYMQLWAFHWDSDMQQQYILNKALIAETAGYGYGYGEYYGGAV